MKMEKKFNRIFALLIIALLFTGSVVTTHFLSAADGSDELPVAVDGAILSPIVTGDTVDWVEIARYNDSTGNYSLIVRTTYLTVRSNNQDEPEFQYTQYSSDDTINYSQSYVRRFINEWFNGGARADELPANARLRDFTMESNAKKVLGTSLTEEALADGFSTPTFNQARTGEDVAFALSYSETAEFLSKIYFLRDQTQTMYSNDIASANFDKITLPKSEHSCMWLRTAGDTNNFAGSLSYMGYAFQDYNGPQTNGYVYPALWVRTSLFDTSYTVHYYLYGTDVSVKADKEMTNQTIGQSITEEAAKIPGYMVLEPSSVTKTLNPSNNEFTFYYTQNTDMTYTVHYYLQGTNTPLQAAKIVTGQTMGAQVIENAVDIAGYTAVDPVSVTLTIKAAGNEIVFNYGPDTYTIDYVDNIAGAAVSGKAVTTYNITSAVTLHTLEKNGYTFNGWYAGSDFTGSAVTAFGPRVIGDKTFYAKWGDGSGNPDEYPIIYAGVSDAEHSNPETYNVTSDITFKSAERFGYRFDGWFEEPSFTTPRTGIAAGTTGSVTVYAKMTLTEYDVIYDANGGAGGPGTETTAPVPNYALNTTTFPAHDRDGGYNVLFMGWSLTQSAIIDKDGTVPVLVAEVTIDDKDVTVYAVWGYDKNGDGTPDVREKQYSILYHVNGGNDNGPANETGLIAGTYTLNTTTRPTHAQDNGYDVLFMGWSLTQTGIIDKDGTVPDLV
ncbi:MAG: InlB B-repeat-containing protein, partial [Methanimicrococcus sp.]|nr:InlB B-repeat-containing protein [Methanimicrococcus sp.]